MLEGSALPLVLVAYADAATYIACSQLVASDRQVDSLLVGGVDHHEGREGVLSKTLAPSCARCVQGCSATSAYTTEGDREAAVRCLQLRSCLDVQRPFLWHAAVR